MLAPCCGERGASEEGEEGLQPSFLFPSPSTMGSMAQGQSGHFLKKAAVSRHAVGGERGLSTLLAAGQPPKAGRQPLMAHPHVCPPSTPSPQHPPSSQALTSGVHTVLVADDLPELASAGWWMVKRGRKQKRSEAGIPLPFAPCLQALHSLQPLIRRPRRGNVP